jgi:aminopeptidase N
MRRSAALIVVVSVCAALALSNGPAGAAPAQAGCRPGAPGLGDPYYPLDGNGGYDIKHTRLDLSYDPATDVLSGVATIKARTTQDLSAFNYDFVGLDVRAITVDGRSATWARDAGELTVTPSRCIPDSRRFVTVVTYDGVPETINDAFGLSGFFHTDDGALVIGQPDVAATWFPANDHPLDKSAFTFAITAPTGLEVLANGTLQSTVDGGAGRTTWTWDAPEPMAPYLAMMAIGEFDVDAYEEDRLPFWDAIDPTLPAPIIEVAQGSFDRQGEIIDFLASIFGPYPFSTAGAIVDNEERLGFALENQTRPIYAAGFFESSIDGDSVIVHELAHQWVGDSLALAAWQHIWLNEGFAQYAEWLWSEHEGLATAQELFDEIAAIPARSSFWRLVVGDPGPDGIFDAPVYYRGAMTLQALRNEVGDRAFFRILRRWAVSREGGNVTTDEFIALAEAISGRQLDDLFQTWLFTPEKPPELDAAAGEAAAVAAAVTAAVAAPPTGRPTPIASASFRRS